MKVFSTVLKVLAALATVAGAVYVAITYGDRIIARLRNLVNKYTHYFCCDDTEGDFEVEEADFEG